MGKPEPGLVFLKSRDKKQFRRDQHEKQNKICPLLQKKIPHDMTALDHKHVKGKGVLGVDGAGLVRGVIHRQANSFEGKVSYQYKRLGLEKLIDLPSLLENLAEYLRNPPIEQKYVHPNEHPKQKKLGKREYNRICKYYFLLYPNRTKLPPYPKSGKMTNQMKKLLSLANELYELSSKKK